MLWLLGFIGAALTFIAGTCLGSALCNRRWAEKCARCQALFDRIHVRPRRSL
jgi:hypothetical protein